MNKNVIEGRIRKWPFSAGDKAVLDVFWFVLDVPLSASEKWVSHHGCLLAEARERYKGLMQNLRFTNSGLIMSVCVKVILQCSSWLTVKRQAHRPQSPSPHSSRARSRQGLALQYAVFRHTIGRHICSFSHGTANAGLDLGRQTDGELS